MVVIAPLLEIKVENAHQRPTEDLVDVHTCLRVMHGALAGRSMVQHRRTFVDALYRRRTRRESALLRIGRVLDALPASPIVWALQLMLTRTHRRILQYDLEAYNALGLMMDVDEEDRLFRRPPKRRAPIVELTPRPVSEYDLAHDVVEGVYDVDPALQPESASASEEADG